MSTGRRWAEDTRPLRVGQSTDSGSGVRGAPRTPTGDESPKNFALAANDTGVVTSTGLPREPITAALRELGSVHAVLGSTDEQAYYRAAHSGGLLPHIADRICITKLGLHPVEVYGDEWLVGT